MWTCNATLKSIANTFFYPFCLIYRNSEKQHEIKDRYSTWEQRHYASNPCSNPPSYMNYDKDSWNLTGQFLHHLYKMKKTKTFPSSRRKI